MLELVDVTFSYGSVRVLEVAHWRVRAGEAWLLSGRSGSGKSTLLHVIAGLATPAAGQVIVAGTDVRALPTAARDRWRGRTIGLVPQRLHLIGAVDVADNLRLAQRLAGLPVDDARIRALLEAVGVGELMHRYPRELSQGQSQRVAIARAVLNRPALVLADEPTASLDDGHAAAALEVLRSNALGVGAALIVASHDARVRPLLEHCHSLDVPARARSWA